MSETIVSVSLRKSWVRPGPLSHTHLVGDIVSEYAKYGVLVSITFLILGHPQAPSFLVDVGNWFFPKLGVVWPALIAQQDLLRERSGIAGATWYAAFYFFLCAPLPLLIPKALIEISRRRSDLAAQAADVIMPFFLFIFSFYVFFEDTG